MYQPLRTRLEAALGVPVEVVTAPDFTEYARRMIHQDYDLAITTGHQARLAQTDAGYVPLLTYDVPFKAVAIIPVDSPFKTAQDLNGSLVLGLSETSLVTLWGVTWLRNSGVAETLRYSSASDSVARMVLSGDAAAGFISLANYQSLAPSVQAQLKFLKTSEPMVGRVYVLNSRQSAIRAKIDAALWSFASSSDGKSYFERYQLKGYRKLSPSELEAMEPYASMVRKTL
jgi:phosphonate transport system substrate-binding protein